ncbi:MAG: hypothetical protein JXR32_08320 [Anaerolineaceae bacterium]|nr:hypothetical protein [Anaerolineaceae bacterium]
MVKKAIFENLVFDENEHPVAVLYVGDEPCYVVDDAGFLRHIPSEQVDRQVFQAMEEQVKGHEEIITDQTAKMLGQDDLFTRAIIQNQLNNISQQFEALLDTGIPLEGRSYLGMMGFKVTINLHGEVLEVHQPGSIQDSDE